MTINVRPRVSFEEIGTQPMLNKVVLLGAAINASLKALLEAKSDERRWTREGDAQRAREASDRFDAHLKSYRESSCELDKVLQRLV